MADNFLYILGAGASCEAVPLVKDFPDSLGDFATELADIQVYPRNPKIRPGGAPLVEPTLFDHSPVDPIEKFIAGEGRKQFVDALRWLANEASQHASVDTLAKKFYLKGDNNDLKDLKAVLSAFLIVVQARKPVDKRYDSFFASVLYRDKATSELQIPSNIRILTWNYDTQLEKAFFGFTENNDEVYAKISRNDRIHRINGYCGKTPDGHWGPDFNSVWESPNLSTAMRHGIRLYNGYLEAHSTPAADIRFAWEHETSSVYLPRAILPNLKETTIAVIIGYSFPYFNRDIDKRILNALPNLKRVYLQYPEGIHATIEERVLAMRPFAYSDAIKHVTVDNQFYIPDEYSGPA